MRGIFSLPKVHLKSGEGLPIVFFHGFLGSALDWAPVCSYLSMLNCIGVDLPGHGGSPFVENFIIDIPRFHLVGYSMGGRLALMYQKKYPNQVASLSLLSTHPGLMSEDEKKQRLEGDKKWAQLLLDKPIEQFLNIWYEQPLFKTFKPNFEMRSKQNVQELSKVLLYFSLAKQPLFSIDQMLVGEYDEKFKALTKKAVIIPNASHAIHLENPKAVAEKLYFMINSQSFEEIL